MAALLLSFLPESLLGHVIAQTKPPVNRKAASQCTLTHRSSCLQPEPPGDGMRQFVAFHTTLRSAYQNFIGRLEEQTKALVRHHLDAATSEFAVHLLASAAESDVFGAQHQGLERMQSGVGVDDPPLNAGQWGEVRRPLPYFMHNWTVRVLKFGRASIGCTVVSKTLHFMRDVVASASYFAG